MTAAWRYLCIAIATSSALTSNGWALTYQDGDGGAYSGTQGTMIFTNLPGNNYGSGQDIGLAGSFIGSGLVSFDDSIGANSGQIALGSTIDEATLTVTVGNASTLSFTAHQLLVGWDENTLTWNTLGGSPGPDAGVDYLATPSDTSSRMGRRRSLSTSTSPPSCRPGPTATATTES